MAASEQPLITDEAPSRTKQVLAWVVPIAIILVFSLALFLIIRSQTKPEVKRSPFTPLAVMADYAVMEDVTLEVTTQGEASPRTEINLVPQVGGKITYVSPNFIEGGIFHRGDTLLRIEDSDYKVAVVRAQSNVAQAQQALTREIAEGDLARRDYAEIGQGQPSDLALRLPQRQQAEAALLAAQAELESANLNLARTQVVAPFNGRVRKKNSDMGQYVSPGFTLGQVFSTDIIEVRLPFMDSDLAKLDLPLAYVAKDRASAPTVKLTAVQAGQLQTWEGRIMRTDSVFDTQTRALYAIAEVVDPYVKGASDHGVPLAPGLFVTAHVKGRSFDDVIVIPRDGLRPDDKVYIVDDMGKAEERKVEVLDASVDRAVIKSGIAPGELVVLSPMERSRLSMTLKALDVNNPKNVLVDPPEPEWMKQKREAAEGGGDDNKKSKKDEETDEENEPAEAVKGSEAQ